MNALHTTAEHATDEREAILKTLERFINSRPGLDPRNYSDYASYRSESRSITRDKHDALALLRAVSWRTGITADALAAAFSAFSGRLSWVAETRTLDYCTGQYYPTEYRKAACAVLASALWNYWRAAIIEARGFIPDLGGAIQDTARAEIGATLARRWFR